MEETIIIKSLDPATRTWIEEAARRQGISVETIIQRLIRRGIEWERHQSKPQHHQTLDELAGTWSEEEAEEFLRATEDFNQVDDSLWQ